MSSEDGRQIYDLTGTSMNRGLVAIIGLGKAGCSIISKLPKKTHELADFFYIHTQEKYLLKKQYSNYISIETPETREFGTNGEPYLGNKSIKFNKDKILSNIYGYEFVFIVAGLGGGTGSGAAPYLAELLKNLNILCISVVSLPFEFEGERKKRIAYSSYIKIKNNSDSIIVIDNETLENNSEIYRTIFDFSDKFMTSVVFGLTGIVTKPGLINVDFDDIRCAINGMGISTAGMCKATGHDRATSAAKCAIKSLLLYQNIQIQNIKSFIISITSGMDMSIGEFEDIGNVIKNLASDDSTVVVGTVIEPEMDSEIEVVVIASGFYDNFEATSSENVQYTEIFRSITFEPEHLQAGISILSYFGDVIKQKYSGINANVRIERNDNSVTLIVESDVEVIEKIEKTLDAYGDVVTGASQASDLLEKNIDIEKLKIKLEMSAMEIRHNEKIISLYIDEKEDTNRRINDLESNIKNLLNVVGDSLKGNNKIALSVIKSANNNTATVQSCIKQIDIILERGFNLEDDERDVITAIESINKEDNSSLTKVRELFVNTAYGVTGNSAYDFLINLINAVPK